jgi:PAS domain S-box-containing protein
MAQSTAAPPPPSFTLTGGNALAERLATLTHDLLGAIDAGRRLVWTNPAWEPVLGWTADELAAGSYHEIVHPDDLERVQAAEEEVLAGRAGARPETEMRLRAKDGAYRWFVFSTSYAHGEELVYVSGKDVTARRLAEEELRAAEERFAAVTHSTSDGIVSADATGRIIFWNAAAERIFGHRAADVLGRPLTVLIPERYHDAYRAGIARYAATGKGRTVASTVEVEGVRANGTEFPMELSLGSWSHLGQPCLTWVIRDVTDRVRTRRALREAEERFAGAFEGAAVGLALLSPGGHFLRANRALSDLLGMYERELAGRLLADLFHPDERGADRGAVEAMLAGRTRRLAAERRIVSADGVVHVARINLSLIRDTDGTPLHFVAHIEDVTQRRRMVEALTLSQARYKTLLTHMPDSAIMLFDHDLRYLLVEGERLRAHGLDPAAMEGRLLGDVLEEPFVSRLEPEYRAALGGETRSFDLDLPDGTAYWVQIVPLREAGGHIIGGMALSRDVSERRRAERALEERARDLERSNAELEQFAYVASHDLSEPLRMVSSYLQLLRRRYHGRLDADADEFIDFAVGGAGRMRSLIDDLLTYSRTGRVDRPLAPVATAEVARRVADDLRGPDAGLAPVVRIGELPTVMGDAQQLGQLFQNLIGNALKFVPEDRTPEVSVSAERDDTQWVFAVEDNGIGIDPAHAERIFRMFQRLHSRDEYPGTGIGLAIARKVVERHGGTIWAESGSAGGARFCFTLTATS